jgi:hypothetical protein
MMNRFGPDAFETCLGVNPLILRIRSNSSSERWLGSLRLTRDAQPST